MGASTSTEQGGCTDQREAESQASSLGALPMLRSAFSKLVDPHTNAIPSQNLQVCITLLYSKSHLCLFLNHMELNCSILMKESLTN